MPHTVGSAAVARRVVDDAVAEHSTPSDSVAALRLIVSELVTNAVAHGAPPVSLHVACGDGRVTIEVADADGGVERVRIRSAGGLAVGGRGLRIVAGLSDEWGVRRTRDGKTIWATNRL